MAHTYTSTKTFTRILFLQRQIGEILRSTTRINDLDLYKLLEAIEKQWIQELTVFAFTFENLCKAKLNMEINWDEYNNEIAVGRVTVVVDERWKDDMLPQTEMAIWAFNKYVDKYNLSTKWRVSYPDYVYQNSALLSKVRTFLGTSPGEPIKWAGKTIEDYLMNKDFPEFGIGLYFVE